MSIYYLSEETSSTTSLLSLSLSLPKPQKQERIKISIGGAGNFRKISSSLSSTASLPSHSIPSLPNATTPSPTAKFHSGIGGFRNRVKRALVAQTEGVESQRVRLGRGRESWHVGVGGVGNRRFRVMAMVERRLWMVLLGSLRTELEGVVLIG
jgi:Protein of unknown function (DUF3602)